MKTTLLFLCFFEGLVTLASCDVFCVQSQIPYCRSLFHTYSDDFQDDICSSLDSLSVCIRDVFRNCGENVEDIDAILNVGEEICRPGSDLNLKIKRHGDCLVDAFTAKLQLCTAKLVKAAQDIRLPTLQEQTRNDGLLTYHNNMKKPVAKICDAFPASLECFYDTANRRCGKDAEQVSRAIGNPIGRLFRKSCDVTAVRRDMLGGAAETGAFSWLLFAFVSLLFLLWN